jgi:CRISPR-associated exonuclease Cas4
VWEENLYTLRGQRVHEKVNVPEHELIEGIRVERAMPLWSHQLGLTGIADVVEFLSDDTPYPVEYKAGAKKIRNADDVQLCAQALCLEEMLNCSIPCGAIFHYASRRRREVHFDNSLRSQVLGIIEDLRRLLSQITLPPPVNDNRCHDCSLIAACMPHTLDDFARTASRNNPFIVVDSTQ